MKKSLIRYIVKMLNHLDEHQLRTVYHFVLHYSK